TSARLARLPSGGSVAVAGLVIARQRPATARGTMFLLFEDEWGHINLIVPEAVYERHRHLARAEPLLLARGRLERAEGVINVIVSELAPLERYIAGGLPDERRDEGTIHHLAHPHAGRPDADGEQEAGAAQVGGHQAQPRGVVGRGAGAAALPRVQPHVMVIAAGREERGRGHVRLLIEAEHVAIEGGGAGHV